MKADKEKLQTPIGAFVTFNDEYSYNQMEAHDRALIEGSFCKVQKAPEPTNIVWENIGYKASKRVLRMVIMVISSFAIFAITFLLMKWIANRQAYLLEKYDSSISCSVINDFYGP